MTMRIQYAAMSTILLLCCILGSRAESRDRVTITLDWVPSAEHYGFYYARDNDIYAKHGLNVEIRNASGAPLVATQLGTGRIKVGTTSSDNILLQAAKGVEFTRLVPISKYNPVSLVSLNRKPIRRPEDINNVVIGTNPQASPYAQFEAFLKQNGITKGRYKEFPIGFGGAWQLERSQVDAFLAYTTNQTIDLKLANHPVSEMLLQDWGIAAYGFVLAIGRVDPQEADVMNRVVMATIEGYRLGSQDVEGAATRMIRVEPSLNRAKVVAAIQRMHALNVSSPREVPPNLDSWVPSQGTDLTSKRELLRAEYGKGLKAWE